LGAIEPNISFMEFVKNIIREFICLSFSVPPVKPPLAAPPSIEPIPPMPPSPPAAAGVAGAAALAASRIENIVVGSGEFLFLEKEGKNRKKVSLGLC